MLGATVNGLGEFGVHRVCRSAVACSRPYQCRHFVASAALQFPATTPEAEAAEKAAKKTGRAAYWFFGVAAAAVIGALAYPQLVTLPPPKKAATVLPPTVPPTTAFEPPVPAKPLLSPREELNERLAGLRAELAELRKQKRNQLVDMKKKSIKEEIAMIQSGIARLEKA